MFGAIDPRIKTVHPKCPVGRDRVSKHTIGSVMHKAHASNRSRPLKLTRRCVVVVSMHFDGYLLHDRHGYNPSPPTYKAVALERSKGRKCRSTVCFFIFKCCCQTLLQREGIISPDPFAIDRFPNVEWKDLHFNYELRRM